MTDFTTLVIGILSTYASFSTSLKPWFDGVYASFSTSLKPWFDGVFVEANIAFTDSCLLCFDNFWLQLFKWLKRFVVPLLEACIIFEHSNTFIQTYVGHFYILPKSSSLRLRFPFLKLSILFHSIFGWWMTGISCLISLSVSSPENSIFLKYS